MNTKQKLALLSGILVISIMGLFPPWKETGPKGMPQAYAPLYDPPVPENRTGDAGIEIDFARLLLQTSIAAILTGGLITAATPAPAETEKPASTDKPARKKNEDDEQEEYEEYEEEEEEEGSEDDEEDATSGKTQVVDLPAGRIYGAFLVEDPEDPDSWEWLADAKGRVELPADRPIQLEIEKDEKVDLSFVTLLGSDLIYSIDLSDTRVKDWDLSNLEKLRGLRELDLSGTKVSNQVFKYLNGLSNLERLWLDGTRVDDDGANSIKKNFKKLVKLSIKDTDISEEAREELEKALRKCEIEA